MILWLASRSANGSWMPLADFARSPTAYHALIGDGLAGAIDAVAERAKASHRFLRYRWFEAALTAYGGAARTIVVERGGMPVLALPMITVGPGWLGAATTVS